MAIDVSELRAHDFEAVAALCQEAGQLPPEMRTPHTFVRCLRDAPGLNIAAREGDRIVGVVFCRCNAKDGCRHELVLPEGAPAELARLLADKAVAKIFSHGGHRGRIKLPVNPITAELWKAAGWGPGAGG